MAEEKLLHAEDVIFNKPSLKELVRLIKNGTINAIWPSTQEEFNAWNDPDNEYGYTAYIDESKQRTADRLRLKSLNTSMTIYYGDNQDATSTGDINIEKTTEKYNQVINSIENQKQEIVSLNYFDQKNEIYPTTNNSLTLSLNSDNGNINNAQNVINYKNNILNEYRKNIEKINDFINRIKNFNPNVETTSLTLNDNDLTNDYNEFFINSTNEINNNFKNTIDIPSLPDAQEEINSKIISLEDQSYDFSKIDSLYSYQEDIVDKILDYLLNYNYELSFDKSSITNLKLISATYQLYKSELQEKINNYYNNWTNVATTNFNIIKKLIMPYIQTYDINQNLETYENDIEKLYEDFIYPYKSFIECLFMIRNPLQNYSDATEFYNSTLDTMKNNVINYSTLEQKINYINQNYINQINLIATNTTLIEQPYVEIKFLSDGTILNETEIVNNLLKYYHVLYYEKRIFEEYEELLSGNQETIIIKDITNFSSERLLIQQKIVDAKENLKTDQDNVISFYNNFQLEYQTFLTNIKNLEILSIPTISFILSLNEITNVDEVYNSINNQQNKLLDHYYVLTEALGYNMEESINNLNVGAQSLVDRIENAKIISTNFGNEQDFIDQVINPDKNSTNDDYTIETINYLLKRITNNELIFEENQIIPRISPDFLTIENKDTVINNLYFILNKGENLNREYILTVKIDNINSLLNTWRPFYESEIYTHYTCIAVGSDIQFPAPNKTNANKTAMTGANIDGTISVLIDNQFYHYPQINNLADTITENTRNTQVLTVGGLASLFGGSGKLTDRNVGNTYTPMYIANGEFTTCAKVVSGSYETTKKGGVTYWDIQRYTGGAEEAVKVGLQATKLFGAVYNDYAEYRSAEAHPGRCIIENGDGTLSLSTDRLQLGANIVSDTYGFAIGETNEATCPVAVCGRVLVYPLESKELFTPGAAVCSGPDGTISLMTREEIREWPDAIVGYVSEIPTYDTWGTDNVPVNGRIWIKIK